MKILIILILCMALLQVSLSQYRVTIRNSLPRIGRSNDATLKEKLNNLDKIYFKSTRLNK